MLTGQQQLTIFSQLHTSNFVRDVRKLPQQLPSSFSPKLNNFSQRSTFNFLKFTKSLPASASDSHKYLISLHSCMINSSTFPRYPVIPLNTTSSSPVISFSIKMLTDEATFTTFLNTLLSHSIISR
ncbi:hypothetical protein HanPSC8_Chr13g0588371 [Helianthus annuus]|nr:hypothetical protein HanPSC8_Chr13g0588371 [Helianthus annuus]